MERSQRTGLDEFYSTVGLDDSGLEISLAEWEFYYTWYRPHSGIGGRTPNERHCELIHQTPLWEEVKEMYDLSEELIRTLDYRADIAVRVVKLSL